MRNFLWIRCKMAYRILLELGWWRSIFVIGLLVFGLSKFLALQNFHAVLAVNLLIIFPLHLTRNDKAFLAQTPLYSPVLFIAEYLLLSSLFLIYFLANQAFIHFFILLACIFFLSFLKISLRIRQMQSFSFALIPARIFEWRAGLRVSWLFLLLMYLLALVFYAHESVLILCWILLIAFFSTFYLQAEGRILLQLAQVSPHAFLFGKVKDYLVLSIIFLSPVFILFFINHIQFWLVGIILLMLSLLTPFFVVFQKYASWQVHISLQQNMILHLLFLVSFALPFLLPVSIFLLVRAYRRAIRNMSYFK
ncbi:hypothetical protein [Thermoflexibacter ruber]|uniref:Uncharacterized protein n=1 Tax=Thermoflexibacter ruber TaxID=1003 RepID=A0A1I2B7D5_9BACT|nr:hypothetical protein [Thermoflexibacter ruber]SFE51907.1 hypothetical protein SAMN04488541_1002159 [Thermoflexibacter ruber]